MRHITDFERKLFLATENRLEDVTEITVRDEYSTVTYTREDLNAIGMIVDEEREYEWLLSQGQEAFEAEIERQRMDKEELERYVAEQCELAIKEQAKRGGNNHGAA
jgi:hypothetical protein